VPITWPNDPLVVSLYLELFPLFKERSPKEMLHRADEAQRAARFIPAGSIYDGYRARLLQFL